ncbi:MAG: type 1 glutamine amidotransferase-like domain-containing protein [Flavobacterium sp.]|nr:type 1 glutamine amidotransferase-like domain-containing protein [Flavobacterium sp.]
MKLLLTSAGISNASIRNALVDLLGKPISACNALFIPTAIYAIDGFASIIRGVISGTLGDPFCEMGWKTIGILELTAMPTMKKELWLKQFEHTDALLVGGGDCQYLTYWMHKSGLAEELPTLLSKIVYVGLSAGSMIMTKYGTTYGNHTLTLETEKCLGICDFAIHPHIEHKMFPDNTFANKEKLSKTIPVPSYAIDDATAIKVTNGKIEVITEGKWKLFTPNKTTNR